MGKKYKMSAAQKRQFTLEQFNGPSITYNIPMLFHLEGNIDIENLRTALNELVKRHEPLRTHFSHINDKFIQEVEEDVEINLEILKKNYVDKDQLIHEMMHPFDLSTAPLMRGALVESEEGDVHLFLDIHHIICDGGSVGTLLEDLTKLYNGEKLEPLKLQYKDYTYWENQQDITNREAFWLSEFPKEPERVDLVTDFQRPMVTNNQGDSFVVEFSEDERKELVSACRKAGVTEFAGALAAFKTLLYRYTNQENIAVGMPVSGRVHPSVQNMLGMFVNTVVFNGNIHSKMTFKDILNQTGTKLFDIYENQDYPFELLVEKVETKRDISRNPLFDIMFAMENKEEESLYLGNTRMKKLDIVSKVAKFDLTVTLIEEKGYKVLWEYRTDLFKKELIEHMAKHYKKLLLACLKDSDKPIEELSMLDDNEKNLVLHEYNISQNSYTNEKTVVQIFEEQVRKTPKNSAIEMNGTTVSYEELHWRSNYISRELIELGVKKNDVVALIMERSVDMVAAIYGVLKSGAAYVPISPEHPKNRIQDMLQICDCQIVITDDNSAIELDNANYSRLNITQNEGLLKDTPNIKSSADDLAYVIFTSGTTGTPKGVMVKNSNLVNLISWQKEQGKVDETSVVLQKSTYIFDASVWEIFLGTLTGAKLLLLTKEENEEPKELLSLMKKKNVTHALLVPSFFRALLDYAKQNAMEDSFKGFKQIFLGAEQVTEDLILEYLEVTKNKISTLTNLYGPTEGTVCATYFSFQEGMALDTIPIGKPVGNTQIVVYRKDKLCGVGIPGELCIAGDSMSAGYINNKELTSKQFVTCPDLPNQKIYKTGDLVRWLPNGTLEYLGRIDDQVKVRGMRIELSEIENRLRNVDSIKDAVVALVEDTKGDKQLSAYYLAEEELVPAELRESLKNYLPDYMVPAYFTKLKKFPKTKSGKLDKSSLPKPTHDLKKEIVLPRNEKERILLAIFSEILSEERISIYDNYFELGGDSIKAIRIVSKLRNCNYTITVKDIMQQRTIEKIAHLIQKVESLDLELEEVSGEVPLTPIQQEFFNFQFKEPHHFNQSFLFEKEGKLATDALKKALDAVVLHHDVLRAVFKKNGKQEILLGKESKRYDYFDYPLLELNERDKEAIINQKCEEIQGSFSLEEGPLVKVCVFQDVDKAYLFLCIHHLVVDGVSWRILIEDLEMSYNAICNGEELKLPLKTTSYKKWSESLVRYTKSSYLNEELDYWKEVDNKIQFTQNLQVDSLQKPLEETVDIYLDKELTYELTHIDNRYFQKEINDLFLTALYRTMTKLNDTPTLSVMLESHGREALQGENVMIDRTVGWFTCMYPVIFDGIGRSLKEQLIQVKETLRKVPNNGIGYGILKNSRTDFSKDLICDVMFNYLGELTNEEKNQGLQICEKLQRGSDISKENHFGSPLSLNGALTNQRMLFSATFDTKVYQKEWIDELLSQFVLELTEIVKYCRNLQELQDTPSDYGELQWSYDEFVNVKDRLQEDKIELISPMTSMQEGLLYHKEMNEELTSYAVLTVYKYHKPIDYERFQKSLKALGYKHDVLRTSMIYKNVSEPRQVLLKKRTIESQFLDLQPDEDFQEKLNLIKVQDLKRGFDLENDSLIRVYVIHKGDGCSYLMFSFHHIILDGWSLSIVLKDLFRLYEETEKENFNEENEEHKITYFDCVKAKQSQNVDEAMLYWEDLLEGYDLQASVHQTIKKREKEGSVERLQHSLTLEETTALERIAANYSVTFSTIVELVWGILLQQYNNTSDVVFGKVVSGRDAAIEGIDEVAGLFINTIPVRVSAEKEDTISSLLEKIQNQGAESSRYDFCPLTKIQSTNPLASNLFHSILAFENYYDPQEEQGEKQTYELIDAREETNYELTVTAYKTDVLNYSFLYTNNLYDAKEIELLLQRVDTIIKQIIADPNTSISNISHLLEGEKQTVLFDFNKKNNDSQPTGTIPELFAKQVRKYPKRVAVVKDGETLTYDELNKRSNQLARKLKKLGLKRNAFVGLWAVPSIETIIGLLGVIKAGGAYLPLDPQYPLSRIEFLVKDSNCEFLLTQSDNQKIDGLTQVDLSAELDELEDNFEDETTSNSTAYLIYTSGTTGEPKGVVIEHRGVLRLVNHSDYTNFEDLSILQTGSLSFDASTFEIWGALLNGGKLCLTDSNSLSDAESLKTILLQNEINTLFITTALFNNLITQDPTVFSSLRHVLFGGEATSEKCVQEFVNHCETKLSNVYGPTECTTFATHYEIDKENLLPKTPIGKPIAKTKAYIMNGDTLCGVGVPGELYISGAGLARGYLNQPQLTEERFIENPFIPGERIYKTGDRVCWMETGDIEYLGRVDEQVKIRGFRIEPGEIENKISELETVENVVVKIAEIDDEKYVCAYIVCKEPNHAQHVKKRLETQLPEYMMPSFIIQVGALPLNKNGKVDKNKLPSPTRSGSEEVIAPRNEMEAIVVEAFENVISQKIEIYDNFFEIGGHSLKAMRLVYAIQELTGIRLTIRDIFSYKTVEKIAEYLTSLEITVEETIEPLSQAASYPTSSVQKRIYAIQQMQGEGISYNIPNLFYLHGEVQLDKLQQAVNQVIKKHESLRTYFVMEQGEVVQKIAKELTLPIAYEECCEAEINSVFQNFIQPFQLDQLPLMRMKLIKLGTLKYAVMLDFHHIIFDGGSTGILLKDLADSYAGKDLIELPIQYKDYAAWENERNLNEQEQYWLNEFDGEISVLDLYTDFPRPNVQSTEGNTVKRELNLHDKKHLLQINKKAGTTDYMVFLSAFMVLLKKYTSSEQKEMIIGTPVAGRAHSAADPLIGMFVNTLAIQAEILPTDTFEEVLLKVKQKCLNAFENQDYPLDMLVDRLDLKRELSRNPLFDIVFTLQKQENTQMTLGNTSCEIIEPKNTVAKFDLTLSITETDTGFESNWEYCLKLFKEESIAKMAEHFDSLVEHVLNHPEMQIKDLILVGEKEKYQILDDFNQTKSDHPSQLSVTELFSKQVKKTPEELALSFEQEAMTYQELDLKSDQIAKKLIEAKANTEPFIGIVAERRLETIIGILAILKVGCAYLPLDSKYPIERVRYILQNSNSHFLMTSNPEHRQLEKQGISILPIPNHCDIPEGIEPIAINRTSLSTAYIMYTSGTTGKPKGTIITDQNITKLVINPDYVCFEDVSILQTGSMTFDASTFEIWGALLNGGKLHLVSEENLMDIQRLKAEIRNNEINTMFVTTALFNQLLDLSPNLFKGVTQVLTGGENASEKHFRKFMNAYEQEKLIHVYGPTECTTFSTYYLVDSCDDLSSLPIGKPISNTTAYILDGNHICGIGMPGELCIGGMGVSEGYLNNEKLTAEKFTQNPYYPEEKMYRTGDLARWRADGNIEFLGRIDTQVKIRGFRIEIGEIENALRTLSKVEDVCVIVRENQGIKYLCAYLLENTSLTEKKVKSELEKTLPEYMIPHFIVFLKKLPLNKNGKIAKEQLPDPEFKRENDYEPPKNEVEKVLQTIFMDVLSVDRIGVTDSFFELGGDSIKAIRIISKMRDSGYEVEVQSILKNKTIRKIGRSVKAAYYNEADQDSVQGIIPLSPIQTYLLESNLQEPSHFNQSMFFEVTERLQIDSLKNTMEILINHHDILRAIYKDGLQQVRSSESQNLFGIQVFDLTSIRDLELLNTKIDALSTEVQQSMDLETGPLVQLGVFKTWEKDYLLLSIHHLVVDGISWRILMEDLDTVYKFSLDQKKPILPYKTASYKKWSEGLQAYRKNISDTEIDYWKNVTKQVEESKFLHVAEVSKIEQKSISFALTQELTTSLLQDCNKQYGTEINDLLLTGLFCSIQELTGKKAVSVLLEGHGRENIGGDIKIERTVGWFTSMYPVALEFKEDLLSEQISLVKQTLRNIPNNGIGYGVIKAYGEKLLEEVESDISFNYLGEFGSENGANYFDIDERAHGKEISEKNLFGTPISVNGMVMNGQLSFAFNYSNRVDDKIVQRFMKNYKKYLLEIIQKRKATTDGLTKQIVGNELSIVNTQLDYEAFIPTGEIEAEYPATCIQQSFLEATGVTVKDIIEVNGPYTKAIVLKSIREVIQEHELFRSTYKKQGQNYRISVHSYNNEHHIPYFDFHDEKKEESSIAVLNEKMEAMMNEQRESDSFIKIIVVRNAKSSYQVHTIAHHAGWDKMSIVLLEQRLQELLEEKQERRFIPQYREYREEISQRNQIMKQEMENFIEMAYQFRKKNAENPLLKSVITSLDLGERTKVFFEEKPWELIFLLTKSIVKSNQLTDYGTLLPLLILNEDRKNKHKDYTESIGAFLDMLPIIQNVDQSESKVEGCVNRLMNNKIEEKINYLEELRSLDKNFIKLIPELLSINYHGLFEIDYETAKNILQMKPLKATPEIFVNRYREKLLLSYPVYEKNDQLIEAALQSQLDDLERKLERQSEKSNVSSLS